MLFYSIYDCFLSTEQMFKISQKPYNTTRKLKYGISVFRLTGDSTALILSKFRMVYELVIDTGLCKQAYPALIRTAIPAVLQAQKLLIFTFDSR